MKASETIVYCLARVVFVLIDLLPLRAVVAIGRVLGLIAHAFLKRTRVMALGNIRAAFPNWDEARVRALARENFARIGEGFIASIKLNGMSWEDIRSHCEFSGIEKLSADSEESRGVLLALGHFGCFDLFGWSANLFPHRHAITTYRGLRPASVNRLFQSRRERSGTAWYDRRFDSGRFKKMLREAYVVAGLLADQRGGTKGFRLPFLGRSCSVEPAPALFALRYKMRLFVAICYRVAPTRWRLEVGSEIATRVNGKMRSIDAILRDMNAQLEEAVRRDPANWFWVHDRWKNPPLRSKSEYADAAAAPPFPASE